MTETQTSLWLQTRDQKKFHLLHPRADDVSLGVIATVLSRIPRFGGHTSVPYSVAEHSLHVAKCVEMSPLLRLPALLHDAHEVYSGFGDTQRPAKKLAPIIKQIERGIDPFIAEHFGFDVALFYRWDIKRADERVLAAEMRDMMGPMDSRPNPVDWEVRCCFGNRNTTVAEMFKMKVDQELARLSDG